MVDPVSRRAARLAALIALPVALVAGFVTFRVLAPGGSASGDGAAPGGGATTAVDVAAPSLAPRTATVCRALLAKLPATLGDLTRRPVTAGAEQNAAYGDPPVTVACGSTGVLLTLPIGLRYNIVLNSTPTPSVTIARRIDRQMEQPAHARETRKCLRTAGCPGDRTPGRPVGEMLTWSCHPGKAVDALQDAMG